MGIDNAVRRRRCGVLGRILADEQPDCRRTTKVFLDDATVWEAEPRINQEFASALGTNVLLGLYTIRVAQSCAEKIESLLNELSVSEKTRGI